jgi:hypothetical protein
MLRGRSRANSVQREAMPQPQKGHKGRTAMINADWLAA